jgi:hypothetical protein
MNECTNGAIDTMRERFLASGDDAELPIVDAHHHFWDLTHNYHPWLCDRPRIAFRYGDYEAICRDFLRTTTSHWQRLTRWSAP